MLVADITIIMLLKMLEPLTIKKYWQDDFFK